mgnify:CR=1 FL=1
MPKTYATWDGRPSPYWQHNDPLYCPKRHEMGWLGLMNWICSKCHTIYVQVGHA